jgi:hypothetical protein
MWMGKVFANGVFREGGFGLFRTWFRRNLTQVHVVLYHTWCLKSHEWDAGFGYFGGEQCVIYEHTKRKKYFQILENLKKYANIHPIIVIFAYQIVRLKFV